jgi:hypothetical protein
LPINHWVRYFVNIQVFFDQLGFVDSFVHSVAKNFNNEQNEHSRMNDGEKIKCLLNIRTIKNNSL